ncbi:MAG: alpha/beta hydrolase-fold protein [Candidatus Sumerlaeaceae bacterium]|nr:alpha/beta hydrolase-fold protein [Candidatus Sumerlaeaceae bacterium]
MSRAPALFLVFLLAVLSRVSHAQAAGEYRSTDPLTTSPTSFGRKSVSTTVTMFSRALNRETTYVVVMPARLEEGRRYPVIYLLHGAYGSYRDWPERARLLDYAAGRPFLVVCPDGGEFGWYADTSTGGAVETFITRDLIADVDSRFPTVASREGRAIAGLSMGGHGALSLAAKHPELFCSASSMSGILALENHPGKWHLDERFGKLDESPEAWRAHSVARLVDRFTTAGLTLYFDTGTSDATGAVTDNRLVHELLTNRAIAHTYAEFPGAHTWRYWDWRLPVHLTFHFDRFQSLLDPKKTPGVTGVVVEDSGHRLYVKRCQEFEAENARLSSILPTSRPIVLLGSSSIQGLDEKKWFPQYWMINRGISGDRIGVTNRGILHRLECSVFALRPRAVFILNGTNDLSVTARTGQPTVDQIVETYCEVLRRIHERLPDCCLFAVSCTPTRDAYAHISPLIAEFNAKLRQELKKWDEWVSWVETYAECVGPDGLLRPELSRDGLHVNDQGYAIIERAVRQALRQKGINP